MGLWFPQPACGAWVLLAAWVAREAMVPWVCGDRSEPLSPPELLSSPFPSGMVSVQGLLALPSPAYQRSMQRITSQASRSRLFSHLPPHTGTARHGEHSPHRGDWPSAALPELPAGPALGALWGRALPHQELSPLGVSAVLP